MSMHNRFLTTVILLGAGLLMPRVVHGAQLYFEPSDSHEGPGFSVELMVQFDEPINALEGVVRFDSSLVSLHRIIESPAGVPLWIEPPSITGDGVLSFAGMFPGGIGPVLTDRIPVLTLTFQALQSGTMQLEISDARVFLHGPTAREDSVRSVPLRVVLEDSDIGAVSDISDSDPPGEFGLEIIRDAPVDDGQTVAIFYARDVGSGVLSYEIRERLLGIFGSYRETKSPSRLSRRWPWSIIDVRVSDRAGNHTVARHVPITLSATYLLLGLFVVWRIVRPRR